MNGSELLLFPRAMEYLQGKIYSNTSVASNISDMDPPNILSLTEAQQYIIGIYLSFIGLLGTVGNSVILLLFWKFNSLRTTTNIFLANLAVSDLGISIFGFPFTAAANFHGKWFWGQAACQWYGFNGMLFGLGSIGFLAAISFDRYLITCKYDLYTRCNKSHYLIVSVLLWTNATVWAAAPLMGWACYDTDVANTFCGISWKCNKWHFNSYIYVVSLVCFVVPCCVITVCYAKTYRFMKKLGCGGLQENVEWTHQRQITKMCAVAILLFLLAWTPFAVFYIWTTLTVPEQLPVVFHVIPPLFAKSATFYNPFIYAMVNKKFRVAIKLLLSCNSDSRALESVPMQPVHTKHSR